jgi:hypothetical protein
MFHESFPTWSALKETQEEEKEKEGKKKKKKEFWFISLHFEWSLNA